jgi:hypothetical protein
LGKSELSTTGSKQAEAELSLDRDMGWNLVTFPTGVTALSTFYQDESLPGPLPWHSPPLQPACDSTLKVTWRLCPHNQL